MLVLDPAAVLVVERVRLVELDDPISVGGRQLAFAEQSDELVRHVRWRRQPVGEHRHHVQAARRGVSLHPRDELLARLRRDEMKYAVSDDDIVCPRELERPGILTDDAHVQRERFCRLTQSRARCLADVHARDPHSGTSQRNRVPPHAAAQVQNGRT